MMIIIFSRSADQRVKIRENKKKEKQLDMARKLKRLWNMRVTVTPVVVGIVPKGLEKLKELKITGRIDCRVKMKENEKRVKHMDLSRELKKNY